MAVCKRLPVAELVNYGSQKVKIEKTGKGTKTSEEKWRIKKATRKFQLDPGGTDTKDIRSFYLPTLEQLKSRT